MMANLLVTMNNVMNRLAVSIVIAELREAARSVPPRDYYTLKSKRLETAAWNIRAWDFSATTNAYVQDWLRNDHKDTLNWYDATPETVCMSFLFLAEMLESEARGQSAYSFSLAPVGFAGAIVGCEDDCEPD